MTGLLHRPRYADVVGSLALIVAMSGTAYAAHALPKNSVGSKQIKNNSVASKDVKDGGVTGADLAAGSVGSAQLAGGAVGSIQVADDSLSVVDLKGTDVSGTISLSLGAGSCGLVTLAIAGAAPGDAGFLTWQGAPPTLMAGPLEFDAPDHASVRMCNPTGSSISVSGLGIRVLTFRS